MPAITIAMHGRTIKKVCQRMQAGETLTGLGNELVCKRLTALPPEIGQIKALKRLNLTDNRLKTLPSELISLSGPKKWPVPPFAQT